MFESNGASKLWKTDCQSDIGRFHTSNEYSVKEVYKNLSAVNQPSLNFSWAKVWNKEIPPVVACLVWRLMHNRIPTKGNL